MFFIDAHCHINSDRIRLNTDGDSLAMDEPARVIYANASRLFGWEPLYVRV